MTAAGMILSMGVGGVGILLMVWHWLERKHHEPEEDQRYFVAQAIRRWVVSGTMILLAVGLFAGSRMEPKIGGQPNLLFLQTWLWVVLLVLILVVIATSDWFATQSYSRRQRKAMLREGIDLLRDEIRVRAALARDGRSIQEADGPQAE
jgi:cobalamin synthase